MSIIKDIKSGTVIALTFLAVIGLVGIAYAATLATVSTGDTLSSSSWNAIVNSVNLLSSQMSTTVS